MLEDSDLALLVAGGSGIAVCWPLVQHLLDRTRPLDKESITSFALRKRKVILVWVIEEEAHLSWLGRPALYDAEIKGASIVVPRVTEANGRPDLNRMINEIVDTHGGGQGKRIRVVASEPDSMGRLMRNTCASMVRDRKDIAVSNEKFE
jgi:NAD(P)H-flavin reductase